MRYILFLICLMHIPLVIFSNTEEAKKEDSKEQIHAEVNVPLDFDSGLPQLVRQVENIERIESDENKFINYRLRPQYYNPVFITLLRMAKTEGDLDVAKTLHRDKKYRQLVCKIANYFGEIIVYENSVVINIPDSNAYTLVPSKMTDGGGTVNPDHIPTPVVATYSIDTKLPSYISEIADHYRVHERSCHHKDVFNY